MAACRRTLSRCMCSCTSCLFGKSDAGMCAWWGKQGCIRGVQGTAVPHQCCWSQEVRRASSPGTVADVCSRTYRFLPACGCRLSVPDGDACSCRGRCSASESMGQASSCQEIRGSPACRASNSTPLMQCDDPLRVLARRERETKPAPDLEGIELPQGLKKISARRRTASRRAHL